MIIWVTGYYFRSKELLTNTKLVYSFTHEATSGTHPACSTFTVFRNKKLRQ